MGFSIKLCYGIDPCKLVMLYNMVILSLLKIWVMFRNWIIKHPCHNTVLCCGRGIKFKKIWVRSSSRNYKDACVHTENALPEKWSLRSSGLCLPC